MTLILCSDKCCRILGFVGRVDHGLLNFNKKISRLLRPLITLFLLGTLFAEAQDPVRITGTVVSDSTSLPLVFAHVGILNTSFGTVTNSKGEFSLLLSEGYRQEQLFVSHVGFERYIMNVSSITEGWLNIRMKSTATSLPEVTVGGKKGSIIEEAIQAIPVNHDQGEMKLSGFWRAQIQDKNQHIQLSEIAFDIFRAGEVNKEKDLLKVLKGRIGRDTTAFEKMNNFQAGIRPEGLFANSFLRKHTILSFRTLKTHDYKITAMTTYGGRPAYVVAFDKKKTISSTGYQGEILLDKETLAFIKINYRLSPLNKHFPPLFENKGTTGGLSKGTWRKYQVELNFQLVDDKWYLSHAYFDAAWELVKYETNFNTTIDYHADLVVTNIDKENVVLPPKHELSRKAILEYQATFGEEDFWKDYTQLVPDQDYNQILQRIRERNDLRQKKE